MWLKVYNLELIFKKNSCYMCFWLTLILIVIISLLFIFFYEYHPYYQTTAIYEKEVNSVSFLLESTRELDLENSRIKVEDIVVDNKLDISDYIVSDNKIYNKISIYLDSKIDKSIVNIIIKLPKTTFFKSIWKGMM